MKKTRNKSKSISGLVKSEVILFKIPSDKLPTHIQSIRKNHEAQTAPNQETKTAFTPATEINLSQLRVQIN